MLYQLVGLKTSFSTLRHDCLIAFVLIVELLPNELRYALFGRLFRAQDLKQSYKSKSLKANLHVFVKFHSLKYGYFWFNPVGYTLKLGTVKQSLSKKM